MDTKLLLDIGLTKNEAETYMTILKSGSSKVGELMKHTALHRSRVYEAINRLADKGLISYVIKNNIKYFEASDPERLVTYIEEQKERLNEKERALKKIIPELKRQVNPLKEHAEAHVLSGKEGFKTMRKDVLKQGKDLFMIGAVGKEDKYLKYFFPGFDKLRIKSRIRWRILYDYEVKGKKITRLPLMETKFLPKEYSSPAVINIYSDRVVNVLWQGEEPLCFMIINKDIADSYRKWFDFLWKNAE